MSKVLIENLSKFYPGPKGKTFHAVEKSNLTIESGEFMVLVGPSGCGKSTTLRMIAGLEEISGGTISIDGRVVNDVPPKDRDIAMVFQNYALYPHMTVYKNMAFGLELRKMPKADIDRRVREAAQILGLNDEILQRKPKALSGGQRQRVALGRAIVRQPKVFLFDEPLSNLDAKMRVQTRIEISKLHRQLGATMIYVTHDQVEAMTMGDRICLMKDGRIQQVAPPLELYNQPANMFVAAFIGSPPMNFFTGQVMATTGALYFTTAAKGGDIRLKVDAAHQSKLEPWTDKNITLGLRPENLEINSKSESSAAFSATIEAAESMGAETYLHLTAAGTPFIVRTPGHAPARTGETIGVLARMDTAHYFECADRAPFTNGAGQVDIEKWQVACPRII